MTTATVAASPPSWRSIYPVHPCADVFPMMSEAELEALAADIKANGLRHSIVLSDGGPHPSVLDGRNRLAALERLGIQIRADDEMAERVRQAGVQLHCWLFDVYRGAPETAAAFVISANIRRRHLTKEQQAELIVKTIEAGHAPTDRARVARSANGQVHGSTKDPVLEKAVTEAKKHGISKRTVQNARAKLHGRKPAPKKKKKIGVSPTPPTSDTRPLVKMTSPSEFNVSSAINRIGTVIHTEWTNCPSPLRPAFLQTLVNRFQSERREMEEAVAGRRPAVLSGGAR
jgi:hypothetical protein